MRALVTGGAGFIGSNLAQALAEAGHEVTVIDNLSTGYRCNIETLRARFVEGDIRDARAIMAAMDGADVVFHLAASVGNKRSIDDPVEDASVNVMGTLQVLQAARRAGVRKVVASSSAGVFGELKRTPIDEHHPVDPDTPYGASKLAAEKACQAFSRQYGLEAISLRYFNVYGPRQRFDAYGNVIPIFVFESLAGRAVTIFGDGEQTRDFVHVRDVVQANLRAAAAEGVSGTFNVGSGSSVTINRLVDLLRETGLDLRAHHGPLRSGDVRDSLADISAAQAAFGFRPEVPLADGLRDYVAWARAAQSSALERP